MIWKMEMVERLKKAINGEKTKIIEEYSVMTGKSEQTLWRIAKKNGYKSGRKKRSDKGILKSELTDQQIEFVASLIKESAREIKGVIMPVWVALEMAEDNGRIEKDQISVARMTAILRERGMSAAHFNIDAPHIQQRSLHPNHVHFFDPSICIQYYLKNGSFGYVDERNFYKNKPDNFKKIKQRLYRYVITDHFSGHIWFQYFYASGETQKSLFKFLLSAWEKKESEKLPFRGVPKILRMDSGSANISKAVLAFLERLNINVMPGKPHTPRSQGQVENAQNLVERGFESKLRFQPAHTVDELNIWALDFCIKYNGLHRHTRHKMTRTQCWLKIRNEQLLELPDREMLQYLFANPAESRPVAGDYSISFRSKKYDVRHIKGIIPKRSKVDVIFRPFDFPVIGVKFEDVEYQVQDIETLSLDEGGWRTNAAIIGEEYKSMPESKTEKQIKKLENLAWGDNEKPKKDDVAYQGTLTSFGNDAQKVTMNFMPRRGTAIEMNKSDVLDQRVPIMQLFSRLRNNSIKMDKVLNKQLRDKYGDSVSIIEVDQIIEEFTRLGTGQASDNRTAAVLSDVREG